MSIVVGGGTGFIGQHLRKLVLAKGYKFIGVSRTAKPNCITWHDITRTGLPEDCMAVVSMSGEPILQPFKRWNHEMKLKIRESRVDKTEALKRAICGAAKPPKAFVSLSGIAYYKPSATLTYTEKDKVQPYDFLSELTRDWEAAATLPSNIPTRSVIVRTGVVLGNEGGMIQNIKLPFSLGLGGPIGTGKQWFSWIHVEDMAGIIMFAIENDKITGVLNGTAPSPVISEEFTKGYASALGRPHLLPLPGVIVNTVFGSEASDVMLDGQKVVPERTMEVGYKFRYPDVKTACKNLVSS